ncbi:SAM-dependent methyltransferase [Streptomyces sp. NPDC049040]|uniref:SAM-dependent methyltransferase n=1 Tax=Streptomyces sp. NPDC049040 TaxID=3365593 RepID=UPI00371AF527
MTDRPSWAPPGIDITVPSVSRVYDYFLGGSHNFEVDREAARNALKAIPAIPRVGQANRAVMRRAVRHAMGQGIDQFLDIGSGIPTFGNVHEVVHALNPDANVVYVDNDPVAVAHSKAVLDGNEHATIAAADLRDPRSVLEHAETSRMLDLDRPVTLLLVAVLHFLSEADNPYEVVATLRDALAPGSILVVTHGAPQQAFDADQRRVQDVYQRTSTPVVLRDTAEVERFFTGFDLLEPGVVPVQDWRPDTPPAEDEDPALLALLAGVGLKA